MGNGYTFNGDSSDWLQASFPAIATAVAAITPTDHKSHDLLPQPMLGHAFCAWSEL